MAEEIASLVVGIDSTSAVAARKDLDALTESGTRTEASAKRAGRAWIDSIERVAAETSGLSSKFDTLNGTQGKLLGVVERMATSLDRMSAAYSRSAGQTSVAQQTAEKTAASMAKLDASMSGAAASAGKAGAATSKASSDVQALGESGARAAAGMDSLVTALAAVVSTSQLLGTIKSVTVDASRYEQTGLIMTAVGKNAGYASSELASLQAQLQKTGISMTQSRETVSRMVQANMDLSQATKLARLAQDAATIGNISSTEALQRMMQGIQSAEVEVLRGIGLNVNFEASYKAFAATLGRTSESLSEQEKMQARVNATMAQAPAIAGLYETSMTNAGKQALSLTRYMDDLSVKVGMAFQPAYLFGVQAFTAAVKLAQENAMLASVAIAAVTAGVGVLTAAMVLSTAAARTLGIAMLTMAANPVVLGIAAVAAAIGAIIAMQGSATAAAKEAAAAQESAAQAGIAGATRLESGINSLIERYRALGAEAKKAMSGAFTASEYSSQRAKLASDLQQLEAQRAKAEAAFANRPRTLEDLRGDRIPGRVRSLTYKELGGGQESKVADANFQSLADLEKFDVMIRVARGNLKELDSAYQGAAEKRLDDYVNNSARMTKSEQMTKEIEDAEKEFTRVTDGMDRESARYAKALASRETEITNIRDKFKEKAGPKAPVVPTDYSPQIAAIEQAAKAESDILARAARDNEAAYQVGLKGAADYYTAKGDLATQTALIAVNSGTAELEVIDRLLASGKGTAAEQRKWSADRAKTASETSRAVLAAFEAEEQGVRELEAYWLAFQRGWTSAAESSATAAEEQAAALRDQVDQYGMSKGAIADLVAVRAREEEAMARTRLAMAVMKGAREEDIALIEREVAALGRRADALADSAGSTYQIEQQDAYDKFAEEAKRQNEQIGDSLTDALMRGFEDGKGFGENFKTTLINMFKTMVLKPILAPIVQGATNYVSGALGLGGQQAGGDTAGTLGSSLNNGSSIANWVNAGVQAFGGYSTGASTASLAYANGVGMLGGDSLGAMIAANGSWAGVPVAGAVGAGMAGAGAAGFAGLAGANAAGAAGLTALGTGAFGAGAAGTVGAVTGTAFTTGAAATGSLALSGGSLVAGGTVGGASAALGGAGAAATAGGAGAAGMGAAAMIPYIGWAIAIAAVLSTVIGNDRTPAIGGNGLVDITGSGTIAASTEDTESKFFGDDRGYKGPSAAMNTGLGALGDQIAAAAKLYGGDASGLSLYAQTAQSPDGKGASGGASLYDKDGNQYFSSVFEGKNEELEANVSLSMRRALLGGLQKADLAPEFANVFKGYGENLGTLTEEQITSITAALEAVRSMNTMFDGLAITFPELAELGWEARTSLVSYSGGLEALTTNLSSYYQTYRSESDRMADTFASMTDTFNALGVQVPTTKAEFASLVDGLSLTDETALKTRAQLLAMNQTFAGWADYTAAQVQKVGERITAIVDAARTDAEGAYSLAQTTANTAMSILTKSINTRKSELQKAFDVTATAMQTAISNAETALGNIKALGDRLKSTLSTMAGTIDPAGNRAQAQAEISTALLMAQMTGKMPQAADLESALSIVSQPSMDLFATFEDYQLDFLKTANDIAKLSALTDGALSIEQRTLDTLKEQLKGAQKAYDDEIERLDQSLALAQGQLDAVLGTTQAVMSVADAIANLNTSVLALASAKAAIPPKNPVTGGALADMTDAEKAVYDAYASSGTQNLDAAGMQFWVDAINNGADPAAIAAQIKATNATKNTGNAYGTVTDAYADSGGTLDIEGLNFWMDAIKNGADPAAIAQQIKELNAINGSHANGLWSVPFDGYRAELHQEEVVLPAPEARAYRALQDMPRGEGGGSTEVVAELRALRQEVQGLRDEARATATHTAKTAKTLDRAMPDGQSFSVREVATA